jgi:hypothetical protein
VDDQSALLRALMTQSALPTRLEQAVLEPNLLSILAGTEGNMDFSNTLGADAVLDPQVLRMLAHLN